MAALVCVTLPAGNGTVWDIFDCGFYSIANRISLLLRDKAALDINRWNASRLKRNFIFRFGLIGLILICGFPLHDHFGTDSIVDASWRISDFCKHIIQHLFVLPPHSYAPDNWRGEEYELWEVCAFMWAVLFIGIHQGKDILTYFKSPGGKGTLGYISGILHSMALLTFMVLGVITLLVFSVSLLRVLFEFLLMLFLAGTEIVLVRAYYKQKIIKEGRQSLEILLFVELPALIAFLAILIFIWGSEGLSHPTRWSHSFVAGASALDLLLANLSLLSIGLVRTYQEG